MCVLDVTQALTGNIWPTAIAADNAWIGIDTGRQWQSKRMRRKRKNSQGLRRWIAAVAAAAFIVAVPLTASALTWDEIWNAVATWAKETFSFVSGGQPTPTEPVAEDERSYNALQELLAETDQASDIVPTWIPNRYILKDIRVDENPMRKTYTAVYTEGNAMLRISVQSYLDADPEKVEINEDLMEIYSVDEVEYYIFSNMDQLRAVWINGSYECNISGSITIEEIKLMIDSIVKG